MPYSPLTKWRTAVLIGLYAVFFLPDKEWERNAIWMFLTSLAFLIPIFIWKLVQNASPFDDRAFHRTLPAGDGAALMKLFKQMLIVVSAIILMLALHFWRMGYNGRHLLDSALTWTLSLVVYGSAWGVAASLASAQGWSRLWAVLVLTAPVMSCVALVMISLSPPPDSGIGFTWRINLALLLAAVLYPCAWWTVAAKRKKPRGAMIAGLTGALAPWFILYCDVDFRPVVERPGHRAQELAITRVPFRDGAPELEGEPGAIPLNRLFKIEGLKADEMIVLNALNIPDSKRDGSASKILSIFPDGSSSRAETEAGIYGVAPSSTGALAWGPRSVWESLRPALPAGVEIVPWNPAVNRFDDPQVYVDADRDTLKIKKWRLYFEVASIGGPVVLNPLSGRKAKLEGGRTLQATLSEQGFLSLELQQEEPLPSGSLVPGRPEDFIYYRNPLVFAVDEEQKKAYALDLAQTRYGPESRTFSQRYLWQASMQPRDSSLSEARRMQLLQGYKLYVFLVSYTPSYQGVTLNP